MLRFFHSSSFSYIFRFMFSLNLNYQNNVFRTKLRLLKHANIHQIEIIIKLS